MKVNKLNVDDYKRLKDEYKISSLSAKILASKNFSDEELRTILFENYDLQQLELSFMNPIVDRLKQAKQQNEKVMICGDYDNDGICATTIMYDTLLRMGIECGYYIPNRFDEGYGVHKTTVQKAFDKGYTLLITVDNGVGSKEALMLAKQLGMDIILSDHHNYDEADLVYDYFIHPNRLDTPYSAMCGAGVALLFSLACVGYVENHIILAGIATIGDIVPLLKINRSLVKEAVRLLNEGKYEAIQLLANDKKVWNESKISFQIVPKINSVGRLADIANVNQVPKFLLEQKTEIVNDFVVKLNELNEKRKIISESMSNKAMTQVSEEPFLVLYDESFHEGINGIVASKFNNEFQKPTMVLSANEGLLKGSIRSKSIDLTIFFNECDCLVSYGGHKGAAGISFHIEDLDRVKAYIQLNMPLDIQSTIDCVEIMIEELTVKEIESLSELAPFGCGFEMPLICIADKVQKKMFLSYGKHVKYTGSDIDYLKFNCGNVDKGINTNEKAVFIGRLSINEYNNKKTMNMILDYIQR